MKILLNTLLTLINCFVGTMLLVILVNPYKILAELPILQNYQSAATYLLLFFPMMYAMNNFVRFVAHVVTQKIKGDDK